VSAVDEAARLAFWIGALREQSQGMTLAAGAGLFVFFAGATVGQFIPKARRYLPWLGVGVFYVTMALLWIGFYGRVSPAGY